MVLLLPFFNDHTIHLNPVSPLTIRPPADHLILLLVVASYSTLSLVLSQTHTRFAITGPLVPPYWCARGSVTMLVEQCELRETKGLLSFSCPMCITPGIDSGEVSVMWEPDHVLDTGWATSVLCLSNPHPGNYATWTCQLSPPDTHTQIEKTEKNSRSPNIH